MRTRNTLGTALAATAAVLFVTAVARPAHAEETVHCTGVNACKGQSACKSKTNCSGPKNDCRGLNACKGQGWLELTKSDCKAALEALQNDGDSDNNGNNGN